MTDNWSRNLDWPPPVFCGCLRPAWGLTRGAFTGKQNRHNWVKTKETSQDFFPPNFILFRIQIMNYCIWVTLHRKREALLHISRNWLDISGYALCAAKSWQKNNFCHGPQAALRTQCPLWFGIWEEEKKLKQMKLSMCPLSLFTFTRL